MLVTSKLMCQKSGAWQYVIGMKTFISRSSKRDQMEIEGTHAWLMMEVTWLIPSIVLWLSAFQTQTFSCSNQVATKSKTI